MPSGMAAGWLWALGAAIALSSSLALMVLDAGAFRLHLGLVVVAGAGWASALGIVARLLPARRALGGIMLVTVLLRLPMWLHAPARSDDIYRYLWDGRVQVAGLDPYAYPPDSPSLAPRRDAGWAHINHPSLPTIYPPLAELSFRLVAASPWPLRAWKLLCALVDFSTVLMLWAWLRRRGSDPRYAIAWAWSPLVTWELGLDAHVDGLGAALLVAGLLTWEGRQRWWAGMLLGLSAATKLLAVLVLPSTRSGRAVAGFVVAVALVAWPLYSPSMSGSLGEYGRRWRANDGAFALLLSGAETLVEHTRFRARTTLSNGRLARMVSGRDRDEIYPDEVAGLAARAVAGCLLLAVLVWCWRRARTPASTARAVIGAFLLLTPTLHPWYGLWLAPLVALESVPSWAWVALLALLPLGHWPLGAYRLSLAKGTPVWIDPIWTRVVEHGLPLGLLLLATASAATQAATQVRKRR